MKALKTFIILIFLFIVSFTLSLCSRETYSYSWKAIFVRNLEYLQIDVSDTINLANYSMKVNFVHQKYKKVYADFGQNYNAFAFKLIPPVSPIDSVTDIKIIGKDNISEHDLTNEFIFKTGYEDGMLGSSSIIHVMNKDEFLLNYMNVDVWKVTNEFYLFPDTSFSENFSGKFIIKLFIDDGRILTDTTDFINLLKL